MPSKPKYGSNAAAGRTFVHDGVKLYYETYGTGAPLLLIHGNAGSIAEMSRQIEHFRKKYQVIAMDSRDHGKSGDSPDALTYEKMTDDLAALLDHLKAKPAFVLGWSDGGIEAILLAQRHPAKVTKIVAMAANLSPKGLHPEAAKLIDSMVAAMPKTADTREAKRERKVVEMMLTNPNIAPDSLDAVQTPALIIAGDHDVIGDEHTLEIFHHLPNSQLCILPNATHMVPYDDPALFNAVVERFFQTPFVKKDRIQDFLKSYEAMKKSAE
jgi:pimeloyl-ACP methyl ester carboxylesterase